MSARVAGTEVCGCSRGKNWFLPPRNWFLLPWKLIFTTTELIPTTAEMDFYHRAEIDWGSPWSFICLLIQVQDVCLWVVEVVAEFQHWTHIDLSGVPELNVVNWRNPPWVQISACLTVKCKPQLQWDGRWEGCQPYCKHYAIFVLLISFRT